MVNRKAKLSYAALSEVEQFLLLHENMALDLILKDLRFKELLEKLKQSIIRDMIKAFLCEMHVYDVKLTFDDDRAQGESSLKIFLMYNDISFKVKCIFWIGRIIVYKPDIETSTLNQSLRRLVSLKFGASPRGYESSVELKML